MSIENTQNENINEEATTSNEEVVSTAEVSVEDENTQDTPTNEKTKYDKLRSDGAKLVTERGSDLGSLRSEVELLNTLTAESKKIPRRRNLNETKESETVVGYSPVGVLLKTNVDIEVPHLPVELDMYTGITKDDVTMVEVKAGETFQLTMYEMMFLIIRPEFGGMLSYKGNPEGVVFRPNPTRFNKGKALLPTPAISLSEGSIDKLHKIIARQEDGFEVLEDGYREVFNHFLKKKTRRKRKSTEAKANIAESVSLGLYNQLYGN